MTSPLVTVNGSATLDGVNIAVSTVTIISLADHTGVTTWDVSCWQTDSSHNAASINSGLVVDPIARTATFTTPANAGTFLFKSRVNSGMNSNGVLDPNLTVSFGIFVLNATNSLRYFTINETMESDHLNGWANDLNALVNLAGTGGGGGGSTTFSGDLSGTSSGPQTVIRINGSTIGTSGAATVGNTLQKTGTGTLGYGAINLAGGSGFVSGTLPASNQAAQTMAGDVTGNTGASVVAKIQGVSVSTTAPSTTGQVLAWNGAVYIPTSQSLSGDVTGSLSSVTVGKLQGFSVSNTNPTPNQALIYVGSTWTPTTIGTIPSPFSMVLSSGALKLSSSTTTNANGNAIGLIAETGTINGGALGFYAGPGGSSGQGGGVQIAAGSNTGDTSIGQVSIGYNNISGSFISSLDVQPSSTGSFIGFNAGVIQQFANDTFSSQAENFVPRGTTSSTTPVAVYTSGTALKRFYTLTAEIAVDDGTTSYRIIRAQRFRVGATGNVSLIGSALSLGDATWENSDTVTFSVNTGSSPGNMVVTYTPSSSAARTYWGVVHVDIRKIP